MPEGNEIHRWAERHTRAFVGKKLRVDSPTGRFADAAALDNRRAGKPCFVCGEKVSKQELAGRTLYWCPMCQS